MSEKYREIDYGGDSPDIILPDREKPEMGEDSDRPEIHRPGDLPMEIGPGLEEVPIEEKKIPEISPQDIEDISDILEEEDADEAQRQEEIARIIEKIHNQQHPEKPLLN